MGYRPQQQQHDLAELDKGGLDAAAEVSYLGSEDLASEGEEEGGGSEGEEAGDEDARGTGDVLQVGAAATSQAAGLCAGSGMSRLRCPDSRIGPMHHILWSIHACRLETKHA